MLNLKTGKTVWADGSFAPPDATDKPADDDAETASGIRRDRRGPPAVRSGTSAGRCRSSPTTASTSIASARSADNKDRWHVVARRRDRQDAGHRSAARRCVGARRRAAAGRRRGRRVPARQQADLVPLRARRLDAPLHARRVGRRREAEAADVGQMGGDGGGAGARRQEVLHHDQRSASRRAAPLHAADRRRRAHEDHVDGRLEPGGGLARRVDAGPGLLLQQQAARGVRDAEHGRRARPSRSRRRRPRRGDRSSGSIRRSSRSRRATASTSTRGSSRRR